MAQAPVSEEVVAAVGRFYFSGRGPSHGKISSVFTRTGYGADAPYDQITRTPNKEERVRSALRASLRRQDRARELVDGLLIEMRLHGCFDPKHDEFDAGSVRSAQTAFARIGWKLADDGQLTTIGSIDLTTGGRPALDEQIGRLRRSTEDPGVLLGSAKDLLEAVAKFVLEELDLPLTGKEDYNHLWHLARERLGILPDQVSSGQVGEDSIRRVLGSAWTIAQQTNDLRKLQGVGHGRTLPTGVSPALALLVVREACSVSEYVLAQLDFTLGR